MRVISSTARLLAATAIFVTSAPAFAAINGLESADTTLISNPAGSTIQGDRKGIFSTGPQLNLDNAGTIRGNGVQGGTFNPDAGIVIIGGPSYITNSGSISGAKFGITTTYVFNPDDTIVGYAIGSVVSNSGSIIGDTDDGIRLIGGGTVTNSGYIAGRLSGGADGISMFAYDGQPTSGFTSIGTVNNLFGGTIEGNRFGVIQSSGGTINNAGTINGGTNGAILIQALDAGKIGTITNSGAINGNIRFLSLASTSISNSGIIVGGAAGSAILGDGPLTLTNTATGSITGAASGVFTQGPTATINNAGTIRSNGGGTDFFAPQGGLMITGGPAIITNTGTISGQRFGISTFGFQLSSGTNLFEGRAIGTTVANSGSIIGDTDDGVRLMGGGSVTNSGYIAGRLSAGADGVSMFAFDDQNTSGFTSIGTVNNLFGGTIEGNRFGVILSSGGTINNAGTINGGTDGSILIQSLDAGKIGTIINSGAINGTIGFGQLASGSVANNGTILGGAGPAIHGLLGMGAMSINNGAAGSITGGTSGIFSEASAFNLTNSGAIRGNGPYDGFGAPPDGGIDFSGGPGVIHNSGTISGQRFGITTSYQYLPATNQIEGRAIGSSIENSGSIIGDTDDGIRLIGGGTVTNSGYIAGRVGLGADGISMFAFDGQNIAGLTGIGSVTNQAGGVIEGHRYGVKLDGGTVYNAGVISGDLGAILLIAPAGQTGKTGSVTNVGNINGSVEFSGLDFPILTNSGTISGGGGPAVANYNGSLTLDNSGTISTTGLTAVQFGLLDDTVILRTGSSVAGIIDGGGGDGYDRAILSGTNATLTPGQVVSGLINFEELTVAAGFWAAGGPTGSLGRIQVNGGTLFLTGTLNGNATVGAMGTFQVGNGGTAGAFVGNLINDGTFRFNRSDNYDFLGSFSGTGTLVKEGAGTLAFLGAYNFTGATQLLGGGIRLSGTIAPTATFNLTPGTILDLSGSAVSQTIAGLSGPTGAAVLLGSGGLTVNQAYSSTYGGIIGGVGSFTKTGLGLLNLTGASTYTGPTSVYGGTLSVNGSIVSPVTVYSGATLGGIGTTGPVTLVAGGVFAPGNSIGTINVGGDLTFNRGSIFAVEANAASQSDRINVTGSVTINGGTVRVLAANQAYRNVTQYTILTARGIISGHFDGVTSNLAFLAPSLDYAVNAVSLKLRRNDKSFSSAATAITMSSATAVSSLGDGNPIYQAVLMQSLPGAQQAFSSLSGSGYGRLDALIADDFGHLHLNLARSDNGGSGVGWSEGNSIAAHGFHSGSTTELGRISLMMVGGRNDNRLSSEGLTADVQTRFMASAVGYQSGRFNALASATAAWHDASVGRTVNFPGFRDRSGSRFESQTHRLDLESSYALARGAFKLASYGGYSRIMISSPAFQEAGGPTALTFDRESRSINQLRLGVQARGDVQWVGATFSPYLDLSAQRAWGDLTSAKLAHFVGRSDNFASFGSALSSRQIAIDTGVNIVSGPITLAASYRGQLGNQLRDHSAQLRAGLRF